MRRLSRLAGALAGVILVATAAVDSPTRPEIRSLPVPGDQVDSGAPRIVEGARPKAWLRRVNLYRELAGLGPVGENAEWSRGDRLHARYTVRTNTLAHEEDPASPWYTQAGDEAARNSNVMASSATSTTNAEAIDTWIQGPFHGVGIIDPGLKATGFGSFRANDGGIQMAAALDVLRGLGNIPPGRKFPVRFPSGARSVPLRSYDGGEYPNPLSSCPGYTTPAGLPIVLQLGPGDVTPAVAAHALRLEGKVVASCVFDETTYTNSDATAQDLGRAVLDGRDAVVIVPKEPLQRGKRYVIVVTANGKTYRWAFTVARNAR
jgi:uncharacterized protein YkwD